LGAFQPRQSPFYKAMIGHGNTRSDESSGIDFQSADYQNVKIRVAEHGSGEEMRLTTYFVDGNGKLKERTVQRRDYDGHITEHWSRIIDPKFVQPAEWKEDGNINMMGIPPNHILATDYQKEVDKIASRFRLQ